MCDCEFCDEFNGGVCNGFAARYGTGSADRLLFGAKGFRVIPTIGQLVEGHLLIVPVRHYQSTAGMSSGEIETFENLCLHVRSVLSARYGNCIFFEHGIRGEGSGGCGIDHAHMHAVPVAADGVLTTLKQEFGGSRVDSLEEIGLSLPNGSSYLFFEDAAGDRYVFPVSNLPSQYMRKLVAESIGKSGWDWRACGYEPELVSTIQRLSPLFSPIAVSRRG